MMSLLEIYFWFSLLVLSMTIVDELKEGFGKITPGIFLMMTIASFTPIFNIIGFISMLQSWLGLDKKKLR